MFEDFLNKTQKLMAQGEPFAVATVVRCLPPTSGKPGDKAIITSDGKLWGWIGGGCAQPVVAKEALKALVEERPRLVRISPRPDAPEEGIVDYTMTCHSGGALDIYIEPVLPKPHLVVLGRSPVALTLARLGKTIGYAVSIIVGEALSNQHSAFSRSAGTREAGKEEAENTDRGATDVAETFPSIEVIQAHDYNLERAKVSPRTMIVVSTQGEGDEEALEQALKTEAGYVAFVASKTKAEKVFDYLQTRGVDAEKIQRVKAPAGLDIGASSPEEIAVSILAEIIHVRAKAEKETTKTSPALTVNQSGAKDPICGMNVSIANARYKAEFEGKTFYFCCANCKQTFEREPTRYLSQAGV
jgi:xanthine dehydrogenase accessory factor